MQYLTTKNIKWFYSNKLPAVSCCFAKAYNLIAIFFLTKEVDKFLFVSANDSVLFHNVNHCCFSYLSVNKCLHSIRYKNYAKNKKQV